MALSACSDNDVAEVIDQQTPGNEQGTEGQRFMSVRISNPAETKADLEGNYEKGLENENTINNLRFYFFDGNGNALNVKLKPASTYYVNYVDAAATPTDKDDMENIELKYQAVVVLDYKELQQHTVSKMVAVANFETNDLGDGSMSLDDLRAKVGSYGNVEKTEDGTKKGNFLMTSSSYGNNEKTKQINAATITPDKLCLSEATAMENPVDIYIERVVAKARMRFNWRTTSVTENPGTTVETKEVSFKGEKCIAIKLKDAEGNAIEAKIQNQETAQPIYVIFNGWNITGKADKSHLFKKVNPAWDNLGFTWNNPTFFRSYWAMNPTNAEGQNDIKLGYDDYKSINKKIGAFSDDLNTLDVAYCQENAADNFATGAKTGYTPATEVSNRTQAIIAATLVTVSTENGVETATELTLAKWGGMDYTLDGVKEIMLGTVQKQIYKKTTSGESETISSIELSDVELATAYDVKRADYNTEDSPRYLTCLKLTNTGTTYYSDAECTKVMTATQVQDLLNLIPGARIWNNGMTYYYTDLRHLAAKNTDPAYYGVVRNHIYDVVLNSVVGLGTPVYKAEDENIMPQKPEYDATYIAAQINILSWRVVSNDTELIW